MKPGQKGNNRARVGQWLIDERAGWTKPAFRPWQRRTYGD
jgi:hypothetical protein